MGSSNGIWGCGSFMLGVSLTSSKWVVVVVIVVVDVVGVVVGAIVVVVVVVAGCKYV